jgi:hypothetical protein
VKGHQQADNVDIGRNVGAAWRIPGICGGHPAPIFNGYSYAGLLVSSLATDYDVTVPGQGDGRFNAALIYSYHSLDSSSAVWRPKEAAQLWERQVVVFI